MKVLQVMFKDRKEEVRISWRTFHNEEFHNLHCFIIIIIIDDRDSVVSIEFRLRAGQTGVQIPE
jgi:hypothetical protein